MKKNKGKKQLKKVGTATTLTFALTTANLSPLAYAGELEVEEAMISTSIELNSIKEELFNEEREEREEGEEKEEEINNEEVVINRDSELNNNQIEIQSSVNTFDLSSWTFKEYSTSIILDKYNGTDTNIVIPGEINGKQVKIGNMKCFEDIKSTINSLVFREENGKKVQAPGTIGSYIFKGYTSLENVDFSGLDTSTTNNMSNISGMFMDCTSLVNLNLSGFITSKVNNISYIFNNCNSLKNVDLTGVDTSKVTSMRYMFNGCESLAYLDLMNFNTEQVIDIDNMFRNCTSLTNLDLSSFNTSKVTTMTNLFIGCSSLGSINFGDNFNTSQVLTMNNMFKDCSSLENLDLNKFDTSSVINMSYMFSNSGVPSLDLRSFDTSSVINMQGMFYNTGDLKKIIFGDNFKTYSVKNMSYMFCSSKVEDLNLSKFDTSSVNNTAYMFAGLENIVLLDLSKFNLNNVTEGNMLNMFKRNILSDSHGNISETDSVVNAKELLVVTTDSKLVNYNYIDDSCLPVGPTLDANGGIFIDGESINSKYKVHVIDNLEKSTIDKIINLALSSEEPTRNGYNFIAWESSPQSYNYIPYIDILNKTYYAKWEKYTPVTLPDDVPVDTTDKPVTLPDDVPVEDEEILDGTENDDMMVEPETTLPDNSNKAPDNSNKVPEINEDNIANNEDSNDINPTSKPSENNFLVQTGNFRAIAYTGLGLMSLIVGLFINMKKKN